MAEKRPNRQKERLRDIRQDAGGNVSYVGDLYRISESGKRFRLISYMAALAAAVICSGLIDAPNAIGSFYVILPYIGEVASLFALIWRTSQVTWKNSIRTFALDTAKQQIPSACRILTVFAAMGLVLSTAYLVTAGSGGKMTQAIIYLVLKLAAAVISELYRRLFISTEWEKA